MVITRMWNVRRRLDDVVQVRDLWRCRCHGRKDSSQWWTSAEGPFEVDIVLDIHVVVLVFNGQPGDVDLAYIDAEVVLVRVDLVHVFGPESMISLKLSTYLTVQSITSSPCSREIEVCFLVVDVVLIENVVDNIDAVFLEQ